MNKWLQGWLSECLKLLVFVFVELEFSTQELIIHIIVVDCSFVAKFSCIDKLFPSSTLHFLEDGCHEGTEHKQQSIAESVTITSQIHHKEEHKVLSACGCFYNSCYSRKHPQQYEY